MKVADIIENSDFVGNDTLIYLLFQGKGSIFYIRGNRYRSNIQDHKGCGVSTFVWGNDGVVFIEINKDDNFLGF